VAEKVIKKNKQIVSRFYLNGGSRSGSPDPLHEPKMDELQCWNDFKKGDKKAFSVIYFNHYNSLYQYALKICGNQETVKDVIHELFLKLWTNRKGLSEPQSLRFYLLKALKRDIVRKLIKDKNRIILHKKFVDVDFEFSPEEVIIHTEADTAQKKLFFDLLNSLPPRQKEALYLKYYEGLTNDEIAEVMSMNYQSVANLLFRGLKTLKDQLKRPF
jgi:RNA polymerase sigma factor (sigma-70 family)